MKAPWFVALLFPALSAAAAGPRVDFAAPAVTVACHDYVEVTIRLAEAQRLETPGVISVSGVFTREGEASAIVDGFRDAADGSTHRVRFAPSHPGTYSYSVTYRSGDHVATHEGHFEASGVAGKGMLRADPEFPAHFQWDGSKERFFWNGLTAGIIATCDDSAMVGRLEILDRARITGIRVALTDDSIDAWRNLERLVTQARDRDIIVAIALAHAADDDLGLARHAIARFAAFRNVIWDVDDPCVSPNDCSQADALRALLAERDPYGHPTHSPRPIASSGAASSCTMAGAEVPGPVDHLRTAWETCLAGGYPTLDACFANACNSGDAGFGDLAMALEPFAHLYDFFTGFTWWELQADPEIVVSLQPHPSARQPGRPAPRAFAARNADGDLAAVYIADGGVVSLDSERLRDQLKPLWFSPRDGGMRNARALRDRVYRTPTAEDWVLLFRTPCNCSFRDFDGERE